MLIMTMMLLKMLLVVATVRLCSNACSPWGSVLDPAEAFFLSAVSNLKPSTVGSTIIESMMVSMKDTNRFTENLQLSMIQRSEDVNTILIVASDNFS